MHVGRAWRRFPDVRGYWWAVLKKALSLTLQHWLRDLLIVIALAAGMYFLLPLYGLLFGRDAAVAVVGPTLLAVGAGVVVGVLLFVGYLARSPAQLHLEDKKRRRVVERDRNRFKRELFKSSNLEVRPVHGESLITPAGIPVVARLAIKNIGSSLLKACSVRLIDAFPVRYGHILSAPQFYPSINSMRCESFLFRWSEQETDASADRKYLDIPADGSERIADILVVDQENPGIARFAAANPEDLKAKLKGIGHGWWKLVIRVSSAIDYPNTRDVELVAACSDRDPGPITLDHWHPKGDRILETQLKSISSKAG